MCVSPKLNESLIMIEEPQYQEFIIEDDEWDIYESKMWDRVEEYYIKTLS